MTEIRSYRRVFDLERRIYRVDGIRLNPGGIPVRGLVYFLLTLAVALLVAKLPILALVAAELPWYVRDVALPALTAALLAVVRVEGRPFHLAAQALLSFRVGPRRLAGLRPCVAGLESAPGGCWQPQPIVMLPDGSDARLRRFRYRGPGVLRIAVAHERPAAGGVAAKLGLRGHVTVRGCPEGPLQPTRQVIVLERATRLSVR